EFKILSCRYGWGTRYAVLAAEPEEARQATACARRQADDDSADRGTSAASGSGQAVLDHRQRRSPARHHEATPEVAQGASVGRTGGAEYSSRNRTGCISFVTRESRGDHRDVSLGSCDRR